MVAANTKNGRHGPNPLENKGIFHCIGHNRRSNDNCHIAHLLIGNQPYTLRPKDVVYTVNHRNQEKNRKTNN